MSLIDKIKWRMIELMITNDLSRAEAIKRAATEVGHVELIKDSTLSTKPKPAISTDASSNLREELLAKIIGIKERQEKRPTLGGRIKRFIFNEDEPAVVAKPVEATPVPSNSYTEVYCGRQNRELIPDSEFPAGMCDTTTDNWRRSLTESKPRVPQNEVNALDNAAVNEALEKQLPKGSEIK
jgi:hypothetical protein